jgi:DNA-binding transcriptional regulator LsrR (DeoR family)
MPPSDEARQRVYYQATAASDHERHGGESCSFLGVGAGRTMKTLAAAFPQARVQGIEPVAALRGGDALHHIHHWPQIMALRAA